MATALIRIDLDSPVPAYRQVTDGIRTLIVEGELQPGDRLPTVRDLAVDLCVHHNTVAQAYRELAAEGWLDVGRRRGATVTHRERPRSTADTREAFSQRLRELVAKAYADGLNSREISTILNNALTPRKDSSS